MADETRSVELGIDNKKALKALAELRKSQEELAKSAKKGSVSFAKAAKDIAELSKQEKDLIKVTRVLDDSFAREEKQLKDTTKAVDNQAQAFGRLADERRKQIDVSGGGFAGDVAGQFGGLRSATSALGGEALSAPLEIGEAFADLAEFGPQAVGSLRSMGEGINLASKSASGILAPLAGLATSAGAAVAPLVGGSVALGTVAAVALPLVAIGVALGGAFKLASDHAKELTESTRANFEAQTEVNALLINSATTSEQFLAARAQVENELALAQSNLAIAQDEYNQVIEDGGILTTLLGPREEELNRIIQEQEGLIADAAVRLGEYNEHVFDASLATADAAIAEAALAEEREKTIAQLEQQSISAEQSVTQALQASERASEQLSDALSSRAQKESDALQVSKLENEFAREDQKKKEQKHRDNLTNIAAQGQERLESLQSGFAQLAQDRADSINSVDEKGNAKLSDLRDDFFESQLESTQDFQRETAKIETDTAKKRTKLLEDLNNRLSDAARDNNVIAFLEAQREGNKKLAEDAIGAQDAEKQRVDEFARQRENERQIFLEKQAETLLGIETEKAAIVTAFAERRVALAEQIEAEKLAIEERLEAENVRFAEQEAREAEQAERARRRAELRQQQEERDFNARIAALRQEADMRQQIHQSELSALAAIQASIAQLQASASSAASGGGGSAFGGRGARRGNTSSTSRLSSFSRSATESRFGQRSANTGTGGRVQPFHDGGVIDFAGGQREGFALVKAGEIVVNPDSLAQKGGNGLPLSLANNMNSSKPSISITFAPVLQTTVGDIASVSEVETALRDLTQEWMSRLVGVTEELTA